VTIVDFNLLAANFGKHLDPPAGFSAFRSGSIGVSPVKAETLGAALHTDLLVDILL
jgi:hypothetical protein